MLITSSQVSVAISSIIVVAFTTALFLSGYAIQQRTLRDLRAAIKPAPRPSPQIYIQESSDWQAALAGGEPPIPPDEGPARRRHDPDGIKISLAPDIEDPEGQRTESTTGGNSKADVRLSDQDGKPQKPLSRAERRQRIKEEIKKLSQGESPVAYQRRLW